MAMAAHGAHGGRITNRRLEARNPRGRRTRLPRCQTAIWANGFVIGQHDVACAYADVLGVVADVAQQY